MPRFSSRLAVGTAISLGIAALIATLLWSIAAAAGDVSRGTVDIWHLLRMTTIQAGLSTVLSLTVGIILAWALDRVRFPGHGVIVGLFGAAIVTPGIIVAFGLLAVWGRAGWVSAASTAVLGSPVNVPIFGLGGILAAHTILDGAFAARVLFARLEAIPAARLKTGQSLALGWQRRFAMIDWPAMRGSLPGLAALIFLLAFTSFPVVLLLGGGPANQTLEVAIYAAVRVNFDLAAAVMLAMVQIAVCGGIILIANASPAVPSAFGRVARQSHWRDDGTGPLLQVIALTVGVVGLALPLVAVLWNGLAAGLPSVLGRATFWNAVGTSLGIATTASALALVLALGLSMARVAARSPLARLMLAAPAYAYLAVPAVVLSLGFFLLIRSFGVAPTTAAAGVVVVANALLALPFAVATLGPPLEAITATRGRLMQSLGLTGWRRFRLVEWPLLGPDIGLVLALSFCFSLGDLGVIALFGTQDFATLPLAMYRALGAYRSNDADAIAALMLILTLVTFAALPPVFGRLSRARA